MSTSFKCHHFNIYIETDLEASGQRCSLRQVKYYQKIFCKPRLHFVKQNDPSSHTLCASTSTYLLWRYIKKGGIVQYYLVIGNGRYISYYQGPAHAKQSTITLLESCGVVHGTRTARIILTPVHRKPRGISNFTP